MDLLVYFMLNKRNLSKIQTKGPVSAITKHNVEPLGICVRFPTWDKGKPKK